MLDRLLGSLEGAAEPEHDSDDGNWFVRSLIFVVLIGSIFSWLAWFLCAAYISRRRPRRDRDIELVLLRPNTRERMRAERAIVQH